MELIAVSLGATQIGRAPFVEVRHSDTRLDRGLELDEDVVVVDLDGGFHAAVVDAVDFSLDDTHYTLRVGVRLPADLAAERLSGFPLPLDRRDEHRVADLLADLREAERDLEPPVDEPHRDASSTVAPSLVAAG